MASTSKKKQQEIPGTERVSIPPLDEATNELLDLESKAARARQQLLEQRAHVEMLMLEHARKKYVFEDGERRRTVLLAPGKSKLRVLDEAVGTRFGKR